MTSQSEWGQALSHRPPRGGTGTVAIATEAHVGPDLPRGRSSHRGRGPHPRTHSAGRPGRRSRGHSGRRPWWAHKCHCFGKSTPDGRKHHSNQEGRLGTEPAGQPPATEEQGARGTAPGTSLIRATSGDLAQPHGSPTQRILSPVLSWGVQTSPLPDQGVARALTQLTVRPRPAQAAGAAAIGRMAQAPVPAGAHALTAHSKPVLRAAWGQKSDTAQCSGSGLDTLWGHVPTSGLHSTNTSWGQSLPRGAHVPGS